MKMRRFIVFILAAVSVFAMVSAASAANWRKVYGDRDIIVHVDTSSIRNHGDYFEVRERYIYNSYQARAQVGILAAFSPSAYGLSQKDSEVTHAVMIKYYKKNESSCKIYDGVMLNRKGNTVCPMNETKWDKCSTDEEAIRRAVKAMKGWK